jgi:hypothetical protein
MPGDPQECRLQAETCLLMAQSAIDSGDRAILSTIADQWIRLALDFENSATFMKALADINATPFKGNGEDKKGLDGHGMAP